MKFSFSNILESSHYHKVEQQKIKKLLVESFKGPDSCFLDIGFGKAGYLDLAKGIGYETFGVDVNPKYVIEAKERGHITCLPDEFPVIKASFDLLLMSHIIEHLEPEAFFELMKKYVGALKPDGILIIATPILGERFYYDATHIRPYYPQSIWHAFGQNSEELSFERQYWKLQLNDIHFIKDSYRTRSNRSYYLPERNKTKFTILKVVNYVFAILYLLSGSLIGKRAAWIGVYKKID